MRKFRSGSLFRFLGYNDRFAGELERGELLVIGEIERDGPMYGYRVFWGRVWDDNRHMVWPEEGILIPAISIPLRRLPPPLGTRDNDEDHPGFIWTGCPIGFA